MDSVQQTPPIQKRPSLTPFPTTHKRRVKSPQEFGHDKRRSRRENQMKEACKDLFKKTWFTYSCSPLHCFKIDEKSLKKYSRILSAVLTANSVKGLCVSTESEDTGTKARFSLVRGLAVLSSEPHAVKLTIDKREGGVISEIYFCSVGAESLLGDMQHMPVSSNDSARTIADQFTVYPLLLCKGNMEPRRQAFNWLKTEFDCNIRKVLFNPVSLEWMLNMWANITPQQLKPKNTIIFWKTPVPDIGVDRIETEIHPESIDFLWKEAHPSASDIILADGVERFMKAVQEHFTQHFKLKFEAFPINTIHLQIAMIHGDGKVKILSLNHVHTVLHHLTHLAVEHLRWFTPGMANADTPAG